MTNKILLITLSLSIILSNLSADDNKNSIILTKGMKVFKMKMRKGCRSTGINFSRKHTKYQWDVIHKNHMLRREAKILCPKLDTTMITNDEWENIYTFITNYPSDNPNIPSC